MNYKYLLFDLDNTLLDDTKNRKYGISKVLDQMNFEYDNKILEEFVLKDDEYWQKQANREFDDIRPKNRTKEEEFSWATGNRIKYFLNSVPFNKCVKLNELYLSSLKEKIFLIDDTIDTLEYLKYKGYLLYIITNGPIDVANKKKELLDKYVQFENIITSQEVGYMKPNKEYFDAMYDKFNLSNKENMLIIGDDLKKDIQGGINENIDTVWFNISNKENNTGITPTYEIKKINELKMIL